MKVLKIIGMLVVVAGIVVVLAAPIGPLPGFLIGGTETPVPAQWGDTRPIHEIKLEVGEGMLPRVVIIWVIQVNGDLHVVGAKDSVWTTAIGNGSAVRMRMEDKTYSMQAALMSSGWEEVVQAYVEKYQTDYPEIVAGFGSLEDAEGSFAVFRLTGSSAT